MLKNPHNDQNGKRKELLSSKKIWEDSGKENMKSTKSGKENVKSTTMNEKHSGRKEPIMVPRNRAAPKKVRCRRNMKKSS